MPGKSVNLIPAHLWYPNLSGGERPDAAREPAEASGVLLGARLEKHLQPYAYAQEGHIALGHTGPQRLGPPDTVQVIHRSAR
jgi:hypothetical protein